MREINVDGVVYVSTEDAGIFEMGDIYLVRTYSAGVFFGHIKSRKGKEMVMTNARRVWSWSGAASLSQLAVDGTSNPAGCKFPCEVPEATFTEVIEILKCTKKAEESLKAVPVWRK